jgi:predicted dehydrogenase
MKKIRLGIVGLGNIGQHYAQKLISGEISRCELTAVCRDKNNAFGARGVSSFDKAGDLFRSGLVDAVIIATPHRSHSDLGIEAFDCRLHVLMDKPIAADKAGALRLIDAASECPDLVFAAMFQMRAEPRYAQIKRILSSGELGKIIRFSWTATDWFRSQAYYESSAWRATWRGEGGGVLINQSLHQLDTVAWLFGMPSRVNGFVQLGRFHDIEVEDTATAFLEFSDGSSGVFIASTGEAPGTNRLEIAGTLGKIVLESDRLQFHRNAISSEDYSKSAQLGFSKPEATLTETVFPAEPAKHGALIQNFVDRILDGVALIAPGHEGLWSIELANVMLYSGLTGRAESLPLDAAAYAAKIEELTQKSTRSKRVATVSTTDFVASFRK